MVDLPGITRTTVDGQDANTVEKILELNMKYMRDPNTIILAIQDGNHDIANSEALTHALKEGVDPEGKRTVGVLTKLDLLHSEAERERVANHFSSNYNLDMLDRLISNLPHLGIEGFFFLENCQ